ncbi:hypothetical protein H310_09433 [Aphanomyces invadans]|uniref:Uncharacterized protein n=1 Tax=Aphanomyces invadans TaxID=157072 RepID=A0A024TV69_9STRA|nr:hypothetical protein H310_09433 [Aphanomyces invadans]ETV97516.1 hypothetical protein H310_09433 [Aphanomyces invadans]|eukprot:XP_008873725.1 hypothetical protein H310_09433 [Aphanomyces invadans]
MQERLMQRRSLADLVDMRAAESTFKCLMDTLEAQANEIGQLKASVAALVLQNSVQSAWNDNVTITQATLMPRIDALEAAIKLPNVRNATLGSIVAANYKEIVSMREKLQRKIDAAVVEDACRRVETKLSSALDTLRKDCVTLELISRLHMDQDELHTKLATVEAQIDSKMDKTEATRMDAVATTMHAFIPRCSEIEHSLQQLHEKLAASNAKCRQHDQHVSTETAHLRQLVSQQHRDVGALRAETTAGQATIEAAVQACKENISLCHNKLQTIRQAHADFAASTRSSLRQLTQTGERNFQSLRDELDGKVSRTDWDAQRREMEALVQTKTPLAVTAATKAVVDKLDEWVTRCDAHVQLSLRFIDWYFNRGDAYEHNMQVMEAQLKQLSLRHVSREPFDGRVRFV